jgi:DNA-binding NtrC family response regulator
VLREVKKHSPATDVIIVTGSADKESAIRALKLGAFDFFEKPVAGTDLTETVQRTLRYRAVTQERDRLAEQVSLLSRREAETWGLQVFVGQSQAVKKCLQDVRLVQRTDKTAVLITGESGTGKELVARAIHYGGTRSARPFIPVNCSAVPSELAESMLFGHLRGSFTGATADKKGCFELAHGGTLFLDEIGDMAPDMQTKLLRVLEDGMITPVGGGAARRVDVRIVAATNADLDARIAAGSFRTDLFYRLARFRIVLPPLRERKADIPLLAEHFAALFASEMGFPSPRVTPEAMEALTRHDYPGNVRELRNVVERALIESGGREISPEYVHLSGPPERAARSACEPPPGIRADGLPSLDLRETEKALIGQAMKTANGNLSEASRRLGISRQKLYRKLTALGMGSLAG